MQPPNAKAVAGNVFPCCLYILYRNIYEHYKLSISSLSFNGIINSDTRFSFPRFFRIRNTDLMDSFYFIKQRREVKGAADRRP